MVADSSNKYAPSYATPVNGDNAAEDVVFENVTPGTKYIVTVVPKANYKLGSWSGVTVGLTSTELLTTTYTVPNPAVSATLTANGISGTYTNKMKDFTKANCTAATNVTDERDNKSYTVAPIGNYCYMLSNLRLEGGTALNTTTSNVSANTFTLPDQDTWVSDSQDHFCEARMHYIGNEYYYNWYAAKANPTTGQASTGSCADTTRDAASLGSICPAGWTLPNYEDIVPSGIWSNGANPGMLSATGNFYSGSQRGIGSSGYWWSSIRYPYQNNILYYLYLNNGADVYRDDYYGGLKYNGLSVRCMRSS